MKRREAARKRAMKSKEADTHARVLASVVREVREAGYTSLRDISEELNRLAVPTARKRRWHATTVARLLARLR